MLTIAICMEIVRIMQIENLVQVNLEEVKDTTMERSIPPFSELLHSLIHVLIVLEIHQVEVVWYMLFQIQNHQ